MLETITTGNGPDDETSPLLNLDIEAEFDLIEKAVSRYIWTGQLLELRAREQVL
jgi:hypothetical protein